MAVVRRPVNRRATGYRRPTLGSLCSFVMVLLVILHASLNHQKDDGITRGLIEEMNSLRGGATVALVCSKEALLEFIKSPLFVGGVLENASLPDTLALAKAEYSLTNPVAEGYPAVIQKCDDLQQQKQAGGGKFHDMVIKQFYLDHILPLDMPENIMSILLGKGNKATVIDIGANIGQFGLPLAKEGHTVFSFEPVEETCEILKNNVHKEKLEDRVHVNCVGLDGTEALKTFGYVGKHDPGSPSHHLIDPKADDAHVITTVQTGPVHKFIEPQNLEQVHLFKTDTQGNEEAVIRGAYDLLHGKHHPRFLLVEYSHVLLHSANTEPKTILEMVYDAGYVCTHLTYHHPVYKKDSKFAYNTVGTPEFMLGDSVTATFDDMVQSIGPHDQWRDKGGSQLKSEVQNVPGWTDILCFG